jgi:hypothetical protein
MAAGIDTRHTRTCRARTGGRCNCTPTYRARIYRDGKRLIRTFPTLAAARGWREDAAVALRERSREHLQAAAARFEAHVQAACGPIADH